MGKKIFTIFSQKVSLSTHVHPGTFELSRLFCMFQGFSLASAIGHSPKIVPDVREFAVQFGQLSETIFGKARCTVMHSDAIVFFALKTIADWSNLCKLLNGSPYFTPQILIH